MAFGVWCQQTLLLPSRMQYLFLFRVTVTRSIWNITVAIARYHVWLLARHCWPRPKAHFLAAGHTLRSFCTGTAGRHEILKTRFQNISQVCMSSCTRTRRSHERSVAWVAIRHKSAQDMFQVYFKTPPRQALALPFTWVRAVDLNAFFARWSASIPNLPTLRSLEIETERKDRYSSVHASQ